MDNSSFDAGRVLVMVGPTGSGKSALAVALGREIPIEVICMDSMQIYRELAVGTDRPGPDQTTVVPHHLYGGVSVTETMTCVRYAAMAREKIEEVTARGRIPLLVGGTGLYMRALFEGMAPLPKASPELRSRLDAMAVRRGPAGMFRLLKRLDPRGAARLHPNDRQRVQRFLEVRILTGRSILDLWAERDAKPRGEPVALGLCLEKDLLSERIRRRVSDMLQNGWIEETRNLSAAGLLEHVFKAGPIGYRQVTAFLNGQLSREALVDQVFVTTRQYAKRQMTWFRRLPYIEWFPFDPKTGYNVRDILTFINSKLG